MAHQDSAPFSTDVYIEHRRKGIIEQRQERGKIKEENGRGRLKDGQAQYKYVSCFFMVFIIELTDMS